MTQTTQAQEAQVLDNTITVENVPVVDSFVKDMLDALYTKMKESGKNIPFNKAQVKMLPIGFTETALWPTKSFEQPRSKYFLPKRYPHLEGAINLFGL